MPASLLLLLDDIATVLDDVATMTKVAVKKTAGVLGDDLALNAQQVTGVRPARELPVVWAVARGSALNKLILVPTALALNWLAPWCVGPLLVAGGAYLCYEGVEKLLHRFLHRGGHGGEEEAHREALARSVVDPAVDPVAIESERIAGAVRTDFILSAEIIVITLGVVAGSPFVTQLAVLVGIAVAMTVGVYGLVAGIVKLDDLGAALAAGTGGLRGLGRAILAASPWLLRGLSVAGTVAMFLVGGGIIAHALPAVHAAVHRLGAGVWEPLVEAVVDLVIGLGVGLVAVAAVWAARAGYGSFASSSARGARKSRSGA